MTYQQEVYRHKIDQYLTMARARASVYHFQIECYRAQIESIRGRQVEFKLTGEHQNG